MSLTGMPESRNSFAVPPVETSSTPKAISLRANSSSPDLSVTLRMARWILDTKTPQNNEEQKDIKRREILAVAGPAVAGSGVSLRRIEAAFSSGLLLRAGN